MCGQIVSETTGGGGRRTDGGIQNQKQEPHTQRCGEILRIECQKTCSICRKVCQNRCQIQCQKKMAGRMSKYMPSRMSNKMWRTYFYADGMLKTFQV